MNWKDLNKVRIHNRNESMDHFIVKAMVLKLLFNRGYQVYSEFEIKKTETRQTRVADIYAKNPRFKKNNKIFVEIETNPTKKKNKELMEFYKDYALYIIDTRDISNNLKTMENQIKHILGI